MPTTVSDLARCLATQAEAVCRFYLSHGRRVGRHWIVGDTRNTPGRSLYVRLTGPPSGRGAAGKWADLATGEYGDLLDLIAAVRDLPTLGETLDEARRFLRLPRSDPAPDPRQRPASLPGQSVEAARRLFARSRPIAGTIAETYLRHRGLNAWHGTACLRFHPRCFYRPETPAPVEARPAMIAAVTDLDGAVTAVQRTWLDPAGRDKAPVGTPRRALGALLGNAVRFGHANDVLAAGEGIETVLSLRAVLPTLPLAAALTAAHLAAIQFPATLRRLYIVRDNDRAGRHAEAVLTERAQAAGIAALPLAPMLGDCNDDLRQLGSVALAASIQPQLAPEDIEQFWRAPVPSGSAG